MRKRSEGDGRERRKFYEQRKEKNKTKYEHGSTHTGPKYGVEMLRRGIDGFLSFKQKTKEKEEKWSISFHTLISRSIDLSRGARCVGDFA